MADTLHTLGEQAAFQLANVTKTPPQYGAITPRWLVRLLDWKPLEASILRVNKVKDEKSVEVLCDQKDEINVPVSFVNYDEKPREYTLSSITTQLDVQTRSQWTDQRAASRQQAGGTRRERKAGRETEATSAVSGTTSGARYDDGQEHAVWLVA